MKKIICLGTVAFLCLCMLTGCTGTKGDISSSAGKDGVISSSITSKNENNSSALSSSSLINEIKNKTTSSMGSQYTEQTTM